MNMITEIEGLPAVGEWLRRSRTEADRSLDDVAASLGIRTGYLDALERGELSRFFGPTYVESMVVRYALHLGIDPDAVLMQAARESASPTPSEEGPLPDTAPHSSEAAPAREHSPVQASLQNRAVSSDLGGLSPLGNGDTPAWLAEDRAPTSMDLPDGGRWSRSSQSGPPEPAQPVTATAEALLADLERISTPRTHGRQRPADNDVPPTVSESRVARNKARALAHRTAHDPAAAGANRRGSAAADDARARGRRWAEPRFSRAWVVPPLAVILAVVGLFGAQQLGFLSLFGGDDGATNTTLQAAVSSVTTAPFTSTTQANSSVTSAAASSPVVPSSESTMLSATTTTGSGAVAAPAASTSTTASSTTTTAPTSTSTTTSSTPATPSTAGGFALAFKATTADVWVELTAVDTGRVLHAGVVAKGGSLDLKVDGPVNAVIGKPEAVTVTVDGQTVTPPRSFKWRITSAGVEQRG